MIATDNEEMGIFRQMTKRFIAENIAPNYAEWEKQGIAPKSIWQKMGESGLLCCDIPEEYGGFGVDFNFNALVVEELALAGFLALSGNMMVHSDIAAHYILNNGTEQQKKKYLPRMVSGEWIGAIAMTEPGAGSDLQAIKTKAVKNGDSWLINGSKTFISNGQNAEIVITAVRTGGEEGGSKGMSLFIIEGDMPGFERGSNIEKIGQHLADTSELFFSDVEVGEEHLLGQLDKGFAVLMNELPRERLIVACGATTHAEGALQLAVEYSQDRKAFGKPISALQDIRFRLADAATKVELHKVLIERYKQLLIEKELTTVQASMAKYSSTEMECEVIDECLQVFGGYGYTLEYPISRYYLDARVQRIYGGTSAIMKEIIGRDLLGR